MTTSYIVSLCKNRCKRNVGENEVYINSEIVQR